MAKKPIEQYNHSNKQRANNPPVGLVTPDTDRDGGKKTYAYDPHLDPQLVWAGKAEHTSFEVPTVSLHVHERIDPRTIIEAVRKKNGTNYEQSSFFNVVDKNPPLREAIQFYQHKHNWSNRMIAGDSLLVMNSLLEKEGLAGQVQMIYIDPPYGIKYGSNFQPFVNKRNVTDGKDEDLTSEPEMIKAFQDTWELEIHSYLTYLRDRLLLARDLLSDKGSVFVQISNENIHFVRNLMDEVFRSENFVSLITVKKTSGAGSPSIGTDVLASVSDYIVWYAKDLKEIKYRQLYLGKGVEQGFIPSAYNRIELADGTRRSASASEKEGNLPEGARLYSLDNLTSQAGGESARFPIKLDGKVYRIDKGSWKTNLEGIQNLITRKRIEATATRPGYVRYLEPVAKVI